MIRYAEREWFRQRYAHRRRADRLQALLIRVLPLVGEHRLERHGLARGADARRNAERDLAKLILAAPAVALDVVRPQSRERLPVPGGRIARPEFDGLGEDDLLLFGGELLLTGRP